MVRPFREREAWEQERDELPQQVVALQRDLDATPAANTPPPRAAGVDDPAGTPADGRA
jgi:hypothetical protein